MDHMRWQVLGAARSALPWPFLPQPVWLWQARAGDRAQPEYWTSPEKGRLERPGDPAALKGPHTPCPRHPTCADVAGLQIPEDSLCPGSPCVCLSYWPWAPEDHLCRWARLCHPHAHQVGQGCAIPTQIRWTRAVPSPRASGGPGLCRPCRRQVGRGCAAPTCVRWAGALLSPQAYLLHASLSSVPLTPGTLCVPSVLCSVHVSSVGNTLPGQPPSWELRSLSPKTLGLNSFGWGHQTKRVTHRRGSGLPCGMGRVGECGRAGSVAG